MKSALAVLALIAVTALSAFFDAKGFVYAALAWRSGSIAVGNALWSLGFFVAGVTLYIASIGFQQRLGVHSPALQSIFWFAMTVIGVALMDGTITHWSTAQRGVALAVTCGVAWLLISAPQ